MREYPQWKDTRERGYITTDMVDACVLASQSNYIRWLSYANTAKKILKKRPNSEPAQKRYNRGMRLAAHYNAIKGELLNTIRPTAAIILERQNKDDVGYLAYTIGNHRHLQYKDIDEVQQAAQRYKLTITTTQRIHYPFYELGNVPSYAAIHNIINAVLLHKITHAINTGSFDPLDPDWTPKPISWNTLNPDKLVPIGELVAEVMPTS